MNIIDELKWRGALNQATDEEGLRELTEEKKIALYCGTDPSGDKMCIRDRINSDASRFIYNEMVAINKELMQLRRVKLPIDIVQDRIKQLTMRQNAKQMSNHYQFLEDKRIDSLTKANAIQNYRKDVYKRQVRSPDCPFRSVTAWVAVFLYKNGHPQLAVGPTFPGPRSFLKRGLPKRWSTGIIFYVVKTWAVSSAGRAPDS